MKFQFLGKTYVLQLKCISYKTPNEWTQGSLNRTEDGKYIVYIDYDKMKLNYIMGELKHLQKAYGLSTILIFQSSEKSYHAVCFDKLTAREYIDLLQNSSCDSAFKNIPRFVSYRNWVLRNFEKGNINKPVLISIIRNNSKREKSYAHWKYFCILYPKIPYNVKLNNFDKLTKITLIKYPTSKC